jgi:hypothetical protein
MSTLWLDRSVEFVGRPCTHALVIGVSSYPNLPSKNGRVKDIAHTLGLRGVETTATSALLFALWLRDHYTNPDAPLATISLLLSPSDRERAVDPRFDEIDAEIPNRAATKEAVTDWRNRCKGNGRGVAMFYASGHGYQVTSYDASVLLDDFGASDSEFPMENTIDVGHVREGMAGPDLPLTQFFFVDACRTRVDLPFDPSEAARGVALHAEDVPDDRVAPIFFGAAPGRASYGQPGKGTVFSQALIAVLSSPQSYKPDESGRWGIPSNDLIKLLEPRIDAITNGKQIIDGGSGRARPICFLSEDPNRSYPRWLGAEGGESAVAGGAI